MKIDSHQHFWEYTSTEYGWIGDEMDILKKDHLPQHLEPILTANGLEGSIAVQARQTLQETHWLLRLATAHPFIVGVVGWVDLVAPGVTRTLESLCAQPKLRGVRHVLQDEPDDQFMLRDDFQRGLRALEPLDLCYDLLVFPRHLPLACELVSRFPRQRFVLDHVAKPPIKDGRLQPWADDVRKLAAFPNVYCKVSGLITEADWQHWRQGDLSPYLDVVLEAFGPGRIMFGSDWPVCTVAGTYARVADAFRDFADTLSDDEQAAVWGGTAAASYQLAPLPH
jgi:L-fuconolactonase